MSTHQDGVPPVDGGNPRRRWVSVRYPVGVALVVLGVWIGLKPDAWMNWLGFSHYAYFVGGNSGMTYALYSGVLPCMLTTIGLGTIISGLFQHLNCHVHGCPRIVRHKIANGEYGVCSKHWRQINHLPDDHRFTIEHLRDHHHAHLRATGRIVHLPPHGQDVEVR